MELKFTNISCHVRKIRTTQAYILSVHNCSPVFDMSGFLRSLNSLLIELSTHNVIIFIRDININKINTLYPNQVSDLSLLALYYLRLAHAYAIRESIYLKHIMIKAKN